MFLEIEQYLEYQPDYSHIPNYTRQLLDRVNQSDSLFSEWGGRASLTNINVHLIYSLI